jgi:prephenate dehydrogenase
MWGLSRNPDTYKQAIKIKAASMSTDVVEISDRDRTDIIVICTPIACHLPMIAALVPQLSIKCDFLRMLVRWLGDH